MELLGHCYSRHYGFLVFHGKNPETTETVFFFSAEQASTAVSIFAPYDEKGLEVARDICKTRLLPKTAKRPSVSVSGPLGGTLAHLIHPLSGLSSSEIAAKMVLLPKSPQLYFFLVPDTENNEQRPKNGILGFSNREGKHSTFIFYSQSQGERIVKDYCGQLFYHDRKACKNIVRTLALPSESSFKPMHILGTISRRLHLGFILKEDGVFEY